MYNFKAQNRIRLKWNSEVNKREIASTEGSTHRKNIQDALSHQKYNPDM